MEKQMKSDIILLIKELENYNSRLSELAHKQLKLLDNTGADFDAYQSFYEDLNGALAVYQ